MHAPPSVPTPDRWIASQRAIATRHGALSMRTADAPARSRPGPPALLLHGFPTWGWDWAEVAARLARPTIAPDLLGYGFSAKPVGGPRVAHQVDALEDALGASGVDAVDLVAHDYGTIVAQEMLDRANAGRLAFAVRRVALLNAGVVRAAYRPTPTQRLLATPVLGGLIARALTPARIRAGLDGVLGPGRRLSDETFEGLWRGLSHEGGHRRAHELIGYIAERARHASRWERALAAFDGPVALIWGLADPVSGAHVLDAARDLLPRAAVTAFDDVGHWPQIEAPDRTAAALDAFLS